MEKTSDKNKLILIICDGMGDLPTLRGKTPLALARKPNIDKMARAGMNGLLHTIAPGVIPGSDTAHLALFGYDPHEFYKGRGVFEALGAGVKLQEGDVALRANFATVDRTMHVIDRRAGRIDTKDAHALGASLDGMRIEGVEIIFKPTTEHRASLILRGKNLSYKITDTDPHSLGKIKRSEPLENTTEAHTTAFVLNEFTHRARNILSSHPLNRKRKLPANVVLARGASVYERAPSLYEKYGFRSACVAGGALYKGVAKFVGMDIIDVKGATGTLETDVMAKAGAAIRALDDYDFIFLHVKGMDNASHDGDARAKIKMIERVDKMIGALLKTGAYIVLTADHSTPISKREHTADPTPILIYGKNLRGDDVKKFDEINVARGALGHLRGLELMPIIVSLMGYAKVYGS
ncbi:MAG: 2,3-bisphosphoglycerate-independent phosphoglycerate mutase [Candidatus Micrarchaeota archaeon]